MEELLPLRIITPTHLYGSLFSGRLKIFRDLGDTDGDGDFDMLFIAGGRSCALWNTDTNLSLIYDSGDAFEQLVAMRRPEVFNSDTDPYERLENSLEDESDMHVIHLRCLDTPLYFFRGKQLITSLLLQKTKNPFLLKEWIWS